MALHPLVAGFTDVAEQYELGRPGYAPEVVAAVIEQLDLAPGARIADVGAGTGKLTRALLAAGLDVVAVEPLEGLRARLRRELPGIEAVEATAEALPFPDASLDAVVCANAFHWFDAPRAVDEFARVLRPRGGLALIWHDEEEAPAPWSAELQRVIAGRRPEHPAYQGDQGRGAVDASPAFDALALTEVRSSHTTDPRRIVAHTASISWVGGLPPAERDATLNAVAAVLERHGVGDVEIPLHTWIWTAARR